MEISAETKLKNSFVDLLMSKPIEKIRISEISKNANVSRVTFYKYYLNKEDLTHKLILDYFNGLNEIFINNIKVLMHTDFSDVDRMKIELLPSAKNITLFFFNNQKIIKAFMSPNSGLNFLKLEYDAFYKHFHDWLPQKFQLNYDPKTLNEYCNFLTRGSALIIGTWFRKDFEQTPDEISKILINILSPTFHHLYHKKQI